MIRKWNIDGHYFRYDDGSGERESWHLMTPQERRFAEIVVAARERDEIPGPTELNLAIGRRRDNNLHGRFSKIRRAIFLGSGLVMNDRRGRWERAA